MNIVNRFSSQKKQRLMFFILFYFRFTLAKEYPSSAFYKTQQIYIFFITVNVGSFVQLHLIYIPTVYGCTEDKSGILQRTKILCDL